MVMMLAIAVCGLPLEARARAAPVSSAGDAGSAGDPDDAMHKFEQAEQLYAAGDYEAAIVLLRELLRTNDDAVLHYNLGRAHEGIGALEDAIRDYERYLERSPDASDHDEVRQRIASLQQTLEQAAAPEPSAPVPEPSAPIDEPPPRPRVPGYVPWIVFGAGTAGLATGGVLGLLARSSERRAADASVQVDALHAHDQARRRALGANVSLVLGGALTAAGLTWGIVSAVSRRRRAAATRVQPHGLGLAARF